MAKRGPCRDFQISASVSITVSDVHNPGEISSITLLKGMGQACRELFPLLSYTFLVHYYLTSSSCLWFWFPFVPIFLLTITHSFLSIPLRPWLLSSPSSLPSSLLPSDHRARCQIAKNHDSCLLNAYLCDPTRWPILVVSHIK